MIVLGRHRPLTHDIWNEVAVRDAIEEIAADAIDHVYTMPGFGGPALYDTV